MNARKLPTDNRLNLFGLVVKTMEQRRVWNLRHREERADFERRAYFPRIDFGEQPAMRPGYHTDDEWGWCEGQSA